MIQQFIDRKEELESLNRFYQTKKKQFIVIYGRRRIGKTELIKQFIKHKPHVYFLADNRDDIFNIKELQKQFSAYLDDSLFEKAQINDWYDLFKEFAKKINKGRMILVIDEFPYLIRANNSILSIFQKVWDEILSHTNLFLILCGSSISMMEKEVLAYNSPIYGRRTGQIRIQPVKFQYLRQFFPNFNKKELIEAFSVLDGIPLYLLKFSDKESIEQNIIKNIFNNAQFLYEEAEILLRNELRELGNYSVILKAIAYGNSRFGNIVNYTGLDKTMITKYIENLINLHIIKKEYPVTSKKEIKRDALYRFNDNYFHFWFRFVYPNKSLIEESRVEPLIAELRDKFKQYVSFVFEDVCRQRLMEKLEFARLGRWWHKEIEIDLIGIDEKCKKIIFIECKWKDNVDAGLVLNELKEKSKYVQWHNDQREEYYCVVAKSFKDRVREKNVLLFDLDDLI